MSAGLAHQERVRGCAVLPMIVLAIDVQSFGKFVKMEERSDSY